MNSQPPRWRLPPSHQELLRAVLAGASDAAVSPEQRAAIRQICSARERHRFEPEDFLIAFKLALVDAAKDVGIPPGPDRNDFMSRLVTVYIEEYYGGPVADRNLRAVTSFDGARTSPDAQPSA